MLHCVDFIDKIEVLKGLIKGLNRAVIVRYAPLFISSTN